MKRKDFVKETLMRCCTVEKLMRHSNIFATIALLTALATLTGCDGLQQPAAKAAAAATSKAPNRGTPRRFVLTKFNGGVAFDTQTGQICRTWEWEPTGPPPKVDADGNYPQQIFGHHAPTCLSLYQEYPSRGLITTVTESDENEGAQ